MTRGRSRAALHRGDSATWTDGERTLQLHAGLGVEPAEVYVPPEHVWRSTAPGWAQDLRDQVIRDFEGVGVRIVVLERARVWSS